MAKIVNRNGTASFVVYARINLNPIAMPKMK